MIYEKKSGNRREFLTQIHEDCSKFLKIARGALVLMAEWAESSLLHLNAVEVHRGFVDVLNAVVGAVCFGPDGALWWGAFADDLSGCVSDDVFGGAMDDDDSGEVVVVKGDFIARCRDDLHDTDALVFEDGLVTLGGRF